MKALLYFLLVLLTMTSCREKALKTGDWRATLTVNDTLQIPFIMGIKDNNGSLSCRVLNAQETINLKIERNKNSLILKFPAFDSEIKARIIRKHQIKGKWHNYAKGNYTMDFEANFGLGDFDGAHSLENVTGNWEVQFAEGSEEEWPAIGIFDQNKIDQVNGTFRTETGDYRHLIGTLNKNELRLSCFDGAHAFLFSADLKDDTILENGKFYSGKHYETTWIANKNNEVKLTNPNELTSLVDSSNFKFDFPNSDFSKNIEYPSKRFENKVTIVQILGSWCPNCMDESKLYAELYSIYNKQGLEIIGVAFETTEEKAKITALLNQYRKDLKINYPILYGGKANKEIASEAFPMLDRITSFPTSIFIDKKGTVRKIHTGFNGPATGDIFNSYRYNTKKFIEALLKEV